MRIMHISAEAAPFVKAGGMGDVVGGLAHAMQRQGHFVEIILPAYSFLLARLEHLIHLSLPLEWNVDGKMRQATVHFVTSSGIHLRLIEIYGYFTPFRRHHVYGESDDIARFIAFSRAAIAFIESQQTSVDIIHLHDWTTALVAPLFKKWNLNQNPNLSKTLIAMTLHNLEMQGLCAPADLAFEGLCDPAHLPGDWQDRHKPHLANLLQGAIIASDLLFAVSPSFAKEMTTPEGGHGLEELLKKESRKIHGILNGIDYEIWNAHKDPFIPFHFSIKDSSEQIRSAKLLCRQTLSERVGLSLKKSPLIIGISRLTRQKSPHLILEAQKKTIELGGQSFLLGSGSDPHYISLFEKASRDLAHHPDGAIYLGLDEKLAHLAYAAADAIIIPSLYEPCGLTQMIAMHYGAIPLARKTGGLADSIIDGENGMLFEYADEGSIHWVIERFFKLWETDREKIFEMQHKGMSCDFSIDHQASLYCKAYLALNPSLS